MMKPNGLAPGRKGCWECVIRLDRDSPRVYNEGSLLVGTRDISGTRRVTNYLCDNHFQPQHGSRFPDQEMRTRWG